MIGVEGRGEGDAYTNKHVSSDLFFYIPQLYLQKSDIFSSGNKVLFTYVVLANHSFIIQLHQDILIFAFKEALGTCFQM